MIAFYREQHLGIGGNEHLISHYVIASAHLPAHACVPVFHIPLKPLRRDMSGAIYRENAHIASNYAFLERRMDLGLALLEYKRDTRLGEQPQHKTRMPRRMLFSMHLPKKANALVDPSSYGTQHQNITQRGLRFEHLPYGFAKIRAVLVWVLGYKHALLVIKISHVVT